MIKLIGTPRKIYDVKEMGLPDTIKTDLEKANHKETHYYLMGFMECQNQTPLNDDYLGNQRKLSGIAKKIHNYLKENKK